MRLLRRQLILRGHFENWHLFALPGGLQEEAEPAQGLHPVSLGAAVPDCEANKAGGAMVPPAL